MNNVLLSVAPVTRRPVCAWHGTSRCRYRPGHAHPGSFGVRVLAVLDTPELLTRVINRRTVRVYYRSRKQPMMRNTARISPRSELGRDQQTLASEKSRVDDNARARPALEAVASGEGFVLTWRPVLTRISRFTARHGTERCAVHVPTGGNARRNGPAARVRRRRDSKENT